MQTIQEIENYIEQIENDQKKLVSELIKKLLKTDDILVRDKIGFLLVDHFKSDIIEEVLVRLIKSKKWSNNIGTLLFLLNEYTTNNKYLNLLVKIILDSEIGGEVHMDSINMLLQLNVPFNDQKINSSLKKIRNHAKKTDISNERKKLIKNLEKFLLGQREIIKFYKKFE